MLFLRGKGLIDGFRSWNTRLFLQDERFYKEKIISERECKLTPGGRRRNAAEIEQTRKVCSGGTGECSSH